ncbi:MAG: catalase family protein [Rhodoferax sp.]|nr:catalase family protein [Rhodoferax sp.]
MNKPVNTASSPLLYDASYEVPEEDEAKTMDGLVESLRKIAETTLSHSGHAMRGVHVKSHGLLRAELRVLDGLPPELAQGIFARAGTWPAVLRFSTSPGDMLDDNVSTPRGLAIKIVGVDGVRLPNSENDVTQDFVMINGPVFGSAGAKKFLGSFKLLASTTDKAPALKKVLSTVLQGAEKAVEALGGESAMLKALGGHPETHVLGETYFTQVPVLYGKYMAKLSLAPVSTALRELKGAPVDLKDRPNGLREAVIAFFDSTAAEWELRVQLCTDLEKMPIEDASVEWPQDLSPYVAVARISAQPQNAWSEARAAAVDDGMAFNPWHGVSAHRPLGSIMRVRKAAYEFSAKFRAQHNRAAVDEPSDLDSWPS